MRNPTVQCALRSWVSASCDTVSASLQILLWGPIRFMHIMLGVAIHFLLIPYTAHQLNNCLLWWHLVTVTTLNACVVWLYFLNMSLAFSVLTPIWWYSRPDVHGRIQPCRLPHVRNTHAFWKQPSQAHKNAPFDKHIAQHGHFLMNNIKITSYHASPDIEYVKNTSSHDTSDIDCLQITLHVALQTSNMLRAYCEATLQALNLLRPYHQWHSRHHISVIFITTASG